MAKKIVASAESLASLNLLIADKEAGKAKFVDEFYWIIIIIIEGIGVGYHPRVQDLPQVSLLDRISEAAIHVFKGASVEELVHLRHSIEVKDRR
jgi:hypothetical protein